MKKEKYIIIAVVILVLAGIYFFLLRDKAAAPEVGTDQENGQDANIDPNTPPASNQLPSGTNALAVSTQIPGSFVTIDNFNMEDPGFIVIHELNSDGGPGTIIGRSGLLRAGGGQDLEISAKIESGKTYIAMIHKDNGNSSFNIAEDPAAINSEGKPAIIQFKVSN